MRNHKSKRETQPSHQQNEQGPADVYVFTFVDPNDPARFISTTAPWPMEGLPHSGLIKLTFAFERHLVVIFALPSVSDVELKIIGTAYVEVALFVEGCTAFPVFKFGTDSKSLHFDAVFHIGLEEADSQQRLLDSTRLSEGQITIVVQDESSQVRLVRRITMPAIVTGLFIETLKRQAIDAEQPDFRTRHQHDVEAFHARMPGPREAFHHAIIKGPAALWSGTLA